MDMTGAGSLVGRNDAGSSLDRGVAGFSRVRKKRSRQALANAQDLEGASVVALVAEINDHLARWARMGVDLEAGADGMAVYLRAQEQRLGPLSPEALQSVLDKARKVRQILLALPAGDLPGMDRVQSGCIGG